MQNAGQWGTIENAGSNFLFTLALTNNRSFPIVLLIKLLLFDSYYSIPILQLSQSPSFTHMEASLRASSSIMLIEISIALMNELYHV